MRSNKLLLGMGTLLVSIISISAYPDFKSTARWGTFQASRFMAGVAAGKGLSELVPLWKNNQQINDFIKNIQPGTHRLAAETINKCLPTVAKLAAVAYVPQGLNRASRRMSDRVSWLRPENRAFQADDGRMAFLLGMAIGPLLKLIAYRYALPVPFDGWEKPL
jgi:hypothetical protein